MTSCKDDRSCNASRSRDLLFAQVRAFVRVAGFKLDKADGSSRRNRRGAAVVEFAIIAPVFLLLVLGMIEWGRMVMVQQILTNASREGARRAVLDGMTASDVQTAVASYLSNSSVQVQTSDITVVTNDPVAPDFAESMTVTISVDFADVSWLPTPMSLAQWLPSAVDLNTLTLSASTTMRREAIQ